MKYSQRRFGVEIECGGERSNAAAANRLAFGKAATNLGNDGSGIELRTPPLKGKAGFEQLRTCMDQLKTGGNWVSRSDGMHVHFEVLDYIGQHRRIANLIRTWMNLDPVFRTLVSPYRYERQSDNWSRKEHADKAAKGEKLGNVYRWNLNLHWLLERTFSASTSGRPTVEVRLHEGSIDADVAIPWIVLMQGMFDTVVKEERAIRPHKNVLTLCNRLGIDGDIQTRLVARSMIPAEAKRLPLRDVARQQSASASGLTSAPSPPTNPPASSRLRWRAVPPGGNADPTTLGYDTREGNPERGCNCRSCCRERHTWAVRQSTNFGEDVYPSYLVGGPVAPVSAEVSF